MPSLLSATDAKASSKFLAYSSTATALVGIVITVAGVRHAVRQAVAIVHAPDVHFPFQGRQVQF